MNTVNKVMNTAVVDREKDLRMQQVWPLEWRRKQARECSRGLEGLEELSKKWCRELWGDMLL